MMQRTHAALLTCVLVGGALVAILPGRIAASSAAPPVEFALLGEPLYVGPMTGRPTLADLDGDGDLDIVVPCGPCCGREPDPMSGHVQVLLNDGTGSLRPAGERIKLGPTTLGAAVGDVDHDGHPDIVVHEHSSYIIRVLLGVGDGRFAPPRSFTMFDGNSPHVHSVALSDVNNDGHLDIAATLVDDHALSVFLGDGHGAFTPALGQPYFAHRHPYAQLNMVDVNADDAVDAVLTDLRGNGLTVLVGSGTGMFASSNGFNLNAHTPITTAERPLGCAVGDLDGDGDFDAVAAIDETPLAVRLINMGRGRFVEPEQAGIELAGPTVGVHLADVTGDNVLDVVAACTTVDFVSITPGVGDGTFGSAFRVHVGGRSPNAAIGDMNGDGANDIVTGNFASGTVSVLIQKTATTGE